MIKVEMHGRLGNQMFQYAAARALQVKTGQKMLFSFRTVLNEADKEENTGWEDSLKGFQVVDYETYDGNKSVLFVNTSFAQKLVGLMFYGTYKPILVCEPYNFTKLYKHQYRWAKLLDKFGIRWMRQGYYPYQNTCASGYVLNGGFEAKRYFDEIRPILLKEFTPKEALTEKQADIANKLVSINSVCISIRHFVLKDKDRENVFGVCDESYYRNAIEEIKKRVKEPVFYICSNDIEWVKKSFDFGDATVIVEDSDDDPVMKLHIMSHCKHFIISNSTFSWWAQYLGDYNEKIVVAPRKWYNNEFESELLNEELWFKI